MCSVGHTHADGGGTNAVMAGAGIWGRIKIEWSSAGHQKWSCHVIQCNDTKDEMAGSNEKGLLTCQDGSDVSSRYESEFLAE